MGTLEVFVSKIKSINKLPDLRKKLIYTLMMFLVARIGTHIPVPGVNVDALTKAVADNDLLSMVNMFSGGAFQKVSIFALGVMPYINASIVMQLLGVIVPQIEEMQKEGDQGRQKIIQYTRYLTIVIGAIQAFGVCMWLKSSSQGLLDQSSVLAEYFPLFVLITVIILTAGTVFLMWLGEQITVNGIGNGISLIIFLNIVDRLPSTVGRMFSTMNADKFMIIKLIGIAALIVFVIAAVVVFQLGQRKIPIQYAGKGFGGKNSIASKTYLPLKINTAGVIPLIFASVILMLPPMVSSVIPANWEIGSFSIRNFFSTIFSMTHPVYLTLYAAAVIFFAFFYTAIMFDPEKIAENLKKSGGTIPGIRPGKETVDYLENVVVRVTAGGAIFLALIAVLPMALMGIFRMPGLGGIGGTGLLIVVGVALDLIQQINVHMAMREYEGFIS